MIPNTLASTGPCAGLWGHLKSIEHAINRALDSGDVLKLTELDRDRLKALADLLRSGLGTKDPGAPPLNLLDYAQLSEPDYSAAIDLKQRITSVSEFHDWQKTARLGYQSKVQRLIQAIEHCLGDEHPKLFTTRMPEEEFKILRVIVQSLLSDAEAALY